MLTTMKYSLLIIAGFLGMSAWAQPTLTKNDNAPRHLDSVAAKWHDFPTQADPGNAGANQTWDMRQRQHDYTYSLVFRNIDQSYPLRDRFPGATLVYDLPTVTGWILHYYSVGDSSLRYHGYITLNHLDDTSTVKSAISYNPPIEEIRYPMTFGKSYVQEDTIMIININPLNPDDTSYLVANSHADAYGVFESPDQKDYDVLRVKAQRDYLDENKAPTGNYDINYYFYDEDARIHLLFVTTSKRASQIVTSGYTTERIPAGPNSVQWIQEDGLSIFPNPVQAGGTLQLEYPGTDLTSGRIQLISAEGKTIDLDFNNGEVLLPQDLPAGIYQYLIKSEGIQGRGRISVR